MDATKLGKPSLGEPPKVLDTIDVLASVRKFIGAMKDPMMLFVAGIHESVVGAKAIREHFRSFVNPVSDDGHESSCGAVGDNLGVDFAVPLDQAKDNALPPGPASSDSTHPPGAKETLINFHLTSIKRTVGLAALSHALTYAFFDLRNRTPAYPGQGGDFCRLDVQRKEPNDLPKFPLGNFGTKNIFVSHLRTLTYGIFVSS